MRVLCVRVRWWFVFLSSFLARFTSDPFFKTEKRAALSVKWLRAYLAPLRLVSDMELVFEYTASPAIWVSLRFLEAPTIWECFDFC